MSASKRPMQLLGLPDELLSEVLLHISVADKQQRVQRSCMQFRRLLKQPTGRKTWGSVGVRLSQPILKATEAQLGALLQWLVSRQAGITEVRLYVDDDVNRMSTKTPAMILHALAGALAISRTPLQMIDPVDGTSMAGLPAFTRDALASTLQTVRVIWDRFRPEHWAPLCSLRSLRDATLFLNQAEPPPPQQPPFAIDSMQLSSLKYLEIRSTNVDIAPLMAHAAALTSLRVLWLEDCSLGTLPAGVLDLPRLTDLSMCRCELTQLPSLASLTALQELELEDEPALTDLRPALAARRQLARLVLSGTTPLTDETLEALRGPCHVQHLDISKRAGSVANNAALGHLVQLMHDRGCKVLQ